MVDGQEQGASAAAAALQRGKACLRCRKRKMRCDGAKPACQQCVRARKSEQCEYDDGKGKTRTQLLRERVAFLEQRIRELEDPAQSAAAIALFDPHTAAWYSESSSSSSGSSPLLHGLPPILGTDRPNTPYTPSVTYGSLAPSPSPIPFGTSTDSFAHLNDGYTTEEAQPPLALGNILIDVFMLHRHQVGFECDPNRIKDSLSRPIAEQRHPALMSAIYLWACFFSRPNPLSDHEATYLARTIQQIPDALQNPTRVLDVIQASCLLSLYYLATARLVEGRYHASAAAALALQAGLHHRHNDMPDSTWDPLRPAPLGPPIDFVEEAERVLAFWQVYNLDRCWSVTLLTAPSIPRDMDSSFSIDVPWPMTMDEYQAGHIPDFSSSNTVRLFLTGQASSFSGGFSMPTLRAKVSALYAYAHRLSSLPDPSIRNIASLSQAVQQQFLGFETLVARFIATLLPLGQLEGAVPVQRHALLTVHTLAHASILKLNARFDDQSPVAHEKCLRAARACAHAIAHINDGDFDYLDPIIGSCWLLAAEILFRGVSRLDTMWPMSNNTELQDELKQVARATAVLGQCFPIAYACSLKIQPLISTLQRP